jgi:riboflavin biosynthesis pyrimidine reductase
VALHRLGGGVSSRVRSRCGNLSAAATDSDNLQMKDASNTTNNTAVTGVTLKVAVDVQGGAADLSNTTTKQERFTCSTSLDRVHRLRAVSDAVLVGKGTVQADNPSLLVRRNISYATQPLRVVIDPQLLLLTHDIERSYQIFTDGYPTVVYHCQKDVDDTLLDLDERCVTLVYMEPTMPALVENHNHDGPNNNKKRSSILSPRAIVQHLRQHFDVEHLMVEGGPVTARQFLQEDGTSIVDRCLIVRAVTVKFPQPLPSGLSDEYLSEQCGLQCLGRYASGVDEITCWTRPNLSWPTSRLEDWP